MLLLIDLPFAPQKKLCDMMDSDSSWEHLAASIGLSVGDVAACRSARSLSPTGELLRLYASRGTTVEQLCQHLGDIGHVRAMDALSDYLSENSRMKMQSSQANEAKRREQVGQQQQRRSAASSKQKPAHVSAVPMAGGSNKGHQLLESVHSTLSVAYAELATATDKFSADRLLGRGGYGVVYKADWKHTTVAVKKILVAREEKADAVDVQRDRTDLKKRDLLSEILTELQALSVYRHDNILPLYGYSLDGPEPCLVYQFMAGGSLESRLHLFKKSSWPPLNWPQRLNIAAGTAAALYFLHSVQSRALIHGDVKSANVLLDEVGRPKLGDFGLCRLGSGHQPDIAKHEPLIASHIKGTLAYLPPEFLRQKHLSTKTDIYSFGVVIYELAAGLKAYSNGRTCPNLVDYLTEIGVYSFDFDLDENRDSKAPDWQGTGSREICALLFKVGSACCEANPALRPTAESLVNQMKSFDHPQQNV